MRSLDIRTSFTLNAHAPILRRVPFACVCVFVYESDCVRSSVFAPNSPLPPSRIYLIKYALAKICSIRGIICSAYHILNTRLTRSTPLRLWYMHLITNACLVRAARTVDKLMYSFVLCDWRPSTSGMPCVCVRASRTTMRFLIAICRRISLSYGRSGAVGPGSARQRHVRLVRSSGRTAPPPTPNPPQHQHEPNTHTRSHNAAQRSMP